MTRDEALAAMLEGKKVRHNYYTSNEYLCIEDGQFKTEDGYYHGFIHSEFWTKYQIWEDGWHIYEEG